MAQNEKEVKVFKAKVVERVSKKGTSYKVLCAEVDGKTKDITFVSQEIEFALYKAGIKF